MGMRHGAGGSTRMKRKTIMTGSRQSTAQLAVGVVWAEWGEWAWQLVLCQAAQNFNGVSNC